MILVIRLEMPAKDGDIYILNVDTETIFQVECVVSPQALQRGLSGRPSLASGTGMFFVFQNLSIQTMWMPDMNFPLDVVWLDETLSVVHISYDLQPCTSRTSCPSSSSKYQVKYAIEMPAGDATKYRFRVGMTLSVATSR
jgi:uncharacterized membrane protein (UPF0127 family)